MSKQSKRRRRTNQERFTTPTVDALPDTTGAKGCGSVKQAGFLAAYALCGAVGKAAKAAGCDRSGHQHWMESDPGYPAKFRAAQDAANEMLENEARRRAIIGIERMKFYKGNPIIDPRTITEECPDGKPYIEHEYSDRMLEILLKAHMSDKYVERQKIESVNIDGGAIPERVQELLDDPARMAFEQEQDAKHLGDNQSCETPDSPVE